MAYGNAVVNGTASLIVKANEHRQELRFINYSTAPDVFLGMDANVTTSNGLPLFCGAEQDASRGFGSTYLGDVWAINNGSGNSDIRFWETTR